MPNQRRLDQLYLDIAGRVAQMSHARRKKVGGIMVKNGNIISMGWNGTPAGLPNECEDAAGNTLPTVLHAELNMLCKIAASTMSCEGATVYTTLSPCMECSKLLLQAGVRRVVFKDFYRDTQGTAFLREAGLEVTQLTTDQESS